ncbi:HAD family hydrolase [Candidatus Albibeggiatoa sp. nov. NOAA]|uniref:P-type ATPase n=1 Tax=Candidatus Albibeggiatoa sp. nov. NOAA TaxID=3162724 RepID=UPI0032F5AFDC|nr:HAD family hydrolase [Thiotrichaceae bacterium]
MLLSVGVLAGTYAGFRLYEFIKKKPTAIKQTTHTPNLPVETKPTQSQLKRYYSLSITSVGLALISPVLPAANLLNIGIISYLSIPIFKRAEQLLIQKRKVGNDALLVLFTVAALAIGEFVAVGLTFLFYYFGSRLIDNVNNYSHKNATKILDQLPDTVWVLRQNVEMEIKTNQLKTGDIAIIDAGHMIPVDGTISQGVALINQQAVTGETQAIEKCVGDSVFAYTTVTQGKIYIKVEAVGKKTLFAEVTELLQKNAQHQSQLQLRADEWADKSALIFLGLYGVTFVTFGAYQGLVVLTGKFGDRLRAVAPLSTFNYLEIAYHHSILIKDGGALENLRHVDTLVFDVMSFIEFTRVKRIVTKPEYEEEDILRYAALAGRKMTHPAAHFILTEAQKAGIDIPDVDDKHYQLKRGLIIQYQDSELLIGNIHFMNQQGIDLNIEVERLIYECKTPHYAIVFVALNQDLIGAIELEVEFYPQRLQLTQYFQKYQVVLVSEENQTFTQRFCAELNIEDYHHDTLPEHKATIVRQLQSQGLEVCYVGDGLRDKFAMEAASVSVSMRGAASMIHDNAQIILLDNSLSQFTRLFDISKQLAGNLRSSLALTVAPTFISIFGGLFFGLTVTAAVVIKTLSFLLAVANASLPLYQIQHEEKQTDD